MRNFFSGAGEKKPSRKESEVPRNDHGEKTPASALAINFRLMSVARTETFQARRSGNARAQVMAREYASSPVQHPALHKRKVRPAFSRPAMSDGRISCSSTSKLFGSRKK